MVETITPAVAPALAHIIERPRLIARLEEGGGSRVSVFAAPAGYGKTTLARQWSERQTGPVVWHRTTRASGDIALLAVQLDELLASVAPDVPRDPGKVASIASVNPSPKPLGRALVRTFEPLTQDVLLVVDEWEAAQTPEAEELLAMLVDGLDIRFVITTRERPEWFAPRLEVYGDGLEIGADELTMTDDEAAAVLATSGAVAGRARVMRTAAGWPAVLGLAAMSGEIDFTSDRLMSGTLYEFLASELLAAAEPQTQEALMLLAVASVVDVGRAYQLLGDGADAAVADATAHGLLAITERKALFFHPLLRDLLIDRFAELDEAGRARLLTQSRRLFEHRLWDEALSVGELSLDAEYIADAIAAALDDLLAAGRTSHLERWVNASRAAKAEGGLVSYAESEYLLRRGDFDEAIAVARQAVRELEGDLAARVNLLAARAAHLGSRPTIRDRHLEAADACAIEIATRADLLWLRLGSAAEREDPGALDLLRELEALPRKGYDHSLRVAAGQLRVGMQLGTLSGWLEEAEANIAALDKANDPYAKSSVLNLYADALIAAGRHQEALAATEKELVVAEEYGLEFVLYYAYVNKLRALTGLRRLPEARRSLLAVERRLGAVPDPFIDCQRSMYAAILYVAEGDLERAVNVLQTGQDPRAGKSLRAEHHAVNALVLTALSRPTEAAWHAQEARALSNAAEMRAFLAAAAAVDGVRREDMTSVLNAYSEIATLGMRNALVVAWRAAPELAAALLADPERRGLLMPLLIETKDEAIARRAGVRIPREARPRGVLSAREHEVHELIAQGLTNEEIAKLLYISLSTTKVHVKHIFEKLGVRSRIEAARLWEDDAT
jgi:LuxR family transcriptional regulator, maltose regulon positive regulatory protein